MRSMWGRSQPASTDRKSTRLNSSHLVISYAVFCLKKKRVTLTLAEERHPKRVQKKKRKGGSAHINGRAGLCVCRFFFFNDTATTEIYTLSLHDALPIASQPASPASNPGLRRGQAGISSWSSRWIPSH